MLRRASTTSSSVNREDSSELGNVFTMLESIRQHAKRERLRLVHRFVAALAVRQNARQVRSLAEPPPVVLALDLDRDFVHDGIVQRSDLSDITAGASCDSKLVRVNDGN